MSQSDPSALTFRGIIPARDPFFTEQPYQFRIKVTLGFNSYVTVFSEPFIINVLDTCLSTQLISVELGPYYAEFGAGPVNVDIDQIKDTVSDEYSDEYGDGSGFDLCGSRFYKLFEEVDF